MKFYDRLFAGTYLYLVKVESGGKIEYSYYFSYLTLLALSVFHLLFYAGILMLIGVPELLLNAVINVSVGMLFFVLGWLVFVRQGRYKAVVKEFEREKKETIVYAMIVNSIMCSLIFLVVLMSFFK